MEKKKILQIFGYGLFILLVFIFGKMRSELGPQEPNVENISANNWFFWFMMTIMGFICLLSIYAIKKHIFDPSEITEQKGGTECGSMDIIQSN